MRKNASNRRWARLNVENNVEDKRLSVTIPATEIYTSTLKLKLARTGPVDSLKRAIVLPVRVKTPRAPLLWVCTLF